jgi:hypothetical protein
VHDEDVAKLLAITVALVLGASAVASPPVYIFRIIALEVVGNATLVTIDAGKNKGLGARWTCFLVDDKKRAIVNGELDDLRVGERTTRGRSTKLTRAQIAVYRNVRCDVR